MQKVSITFDDGPQKGTIDFDYEQGTPPPMGKASVMLAWMFYSLSGDKVGKSSGGATPASYLLMQAGEREAVENLEPRAKRMMYAVAERAERDGTVYIKATYLPTDGPYQLEAPAAK